MTSSKKKSKDDSPASPSSTRSNLSSKSSRRSFMPSSTSRPTSLVDLETTSFPSMSLSFDSNSLVKDSIESTSSNHQLGSNSPSSSPSSSNFIPPLHQSTASQRLSEIRSRNKTSDPSSSSSPSSLSFPSTQNQNQNQDQDSRSIKSDSSATNDSAVKHTRKVSTPTTTTTSTPSLPSLIASRKPKTSQPSISYNNQTSHATDSGSGVTSSHERQRVSSTSSRGSIRSNNFSTYTPSTSTSTSTSPPSHFLNKSNETKNGSPSSFSSSSRSPSNVQSEENGALEALRALSAFDKQDKGKTSINDSNSRKDGKDVQGGNGNGNEEEIIRKNEKMKVKENVNEEEKKGEFKPHQKHVNFNPSEEPPSSIRKRNQSKKEKELKPFHLIYKGEILNYSPRIKIDSDSISSIHPTSYSSSSSNSRSRHSSQNNGSHGGDDAGDDDQDFISKEKGILEISLTFQGESSFLPSIQFLPFPPKRINSSSLSIKPIEIKLRPNDWKLLSSIPLNGIVGYWVERGSRVSSMIQNLL